MEQKVLQLSFLTVIILSALFLGFVEENDLVGRAVVSFEEANEFKEVEELLLGGIEIDSL